MKVKSYIEKGNSFPIIVESNDREYFIKLRAGMSGKHAMISEWIGNKLGAHFNINTQVPTWINIDDSIQAKDIYIEVRELIKKSYGLNIGFEYQSTSTELKANDIELLSKKMADEIFLFDILMINIDRTPANMNLIKVDKEIISLDYESSFLIPELLDGKNFLHNKRVLQCLRSNPLYREINEETIDSFLIKANSISIENVLSEIPASLLNPVDKSSIENGIIARKRNQWYIKETLSELREITIETKEEHKLRINRNQEDFKNRLVRSYKKSDGNI